MLNPLNIEVGALRGRTVRELVLIAGGSAFTVSAVLRDEPWAFIAVYALATTSFLLRFFPARAFAVATSIAAITQQLVCTNFALRWNAWILYVPFVVLAGTLSRDLTRRFDRAPSRVSWLPNRWADLPENHAQRLRVCGYALAAQAAALFARQSMLGTHSLSTYVAIGVLWGTLAMLTLGRAMAIFLAPLVSLPAAYIWVSQLEAVGTRGPEGAAKELAMQAVGPLCAATACAVSLTYVAQLLRILRAPSAGAR